MNRGDKRERGGEGGGGGLGGGLNPPSGSVKIVLNFLLRAAAEAVAAVKLIGVQGYIRRSHIL